jgi:hypothetical protein
MFIIIAMVLGAMLAEEEWCETTTTVIWVAGMVIVADLYAFNEFMKYLKNRDK